MIFLSGELNDKVSFKIISSILRINENDPNLPIKFYINSPGGSVTAGNTDIRSHYFNYTISSY